MTIEQPQKKEIYIQEYERVKTRLLEIFQNKNEQEIEGLCSEVRKFASLVNWNPEIIVEEIKKGFNQENSEIFVQISFNAMKKLIDQKIEHPESFERVRQEETKQHGENIKLYGLMYYEVDLKNGVAFIHIAPKENLRLSEVVKSFREGMRELAKQVKEDERIKEIQATSWIVASNPGLLEKAGFTLRGPIDEKLKTEHFSSEERPISWANMSRETLLEKYLNT